MEYHFENDRLDVQRSPEEKRPLLQRLMRVEGQVRGLRQMVEKDRYVGEKIQQAGAITAAVREVVLMMISQHLEAALQYASENDHDHHAAVEEMVGLLRTAMRQRPSSTVGTDSAQSD